MGFVADFWLTVTLFCYWWWIVGGGGSAWSGCGGGDGGFGAFVDEFCGGKKFGG